MTKTSGLESIATKLERIAKQAREAPGMVFTTLAHHIDIGWLHEAYRRTCKSGAVGVDGQMVRDYAVNLNENPGSLLERFKSGRYQALPVRRAHIPKGRGRETRAIGITTFDDKVLQRAVTKLRSSRIDSPTRIRWRPERVLLALVAILIVLPLAGCLGFSAVNTQLEQYDPTRGYRATDRSQRRNSGKTIIYVAFSGGGTRAAAFAYGVLEELRDTKVPVDGVETSLLEEVDSISGVSGGSFPAAYYGLFGDRIFEDFESRFLKKNVQGALLLQALRPWNLLRLLTPWLSRSDLASSYYSKKIFDGATYADLTKAGGPMIRINATDLSSGSRFTFDQNTFDIICSDNDVFPISTAVAASSAVPMLLSPITLKNYAGTCGYDPPEWVVEALANRHTDRRRNRTAQTFMDFSDAEKKQYIHLVDGGISDNLALRPAIEFVTAVGGIEKVREITGAEIPDHLVVIAVNAETDPDPKIDLTAASPSFASLMNSVSGSQIRRYNFETLMLVHDMIRAWGEDLSTDDHPVTSHMIYVGFDELEDEQERQYLKWLPTSFVLQDVEVDRLREAGRRLLRESREFQQLLEELKE